MADICQFLPPSRGFAFIYFLISEMPIQKELEDWEKSQTIQVYLLEEVTGKLSWREMVTKL